MTKNYKNSENNAQMSLNNDKYNSVLSDLQDYILNEQNIQKLVVVSEKQPVIEKISIPVIEKEKISIPVIEKQTETIFIPHISDTLFWCFYIITQGLTAYETIYNKNNVIAKQLKIDWVEKLRKHKQIIKTYKFDTIVNIESNLANDSYINVKTFLSLCAVENLNVIVVNKKIYYELLMNDSDTVYVIREIENKQNIKMHRYGYEIGTKDMVNTIKSTLYKVDNIDKPIKALSSYKVQDLIEICTKLAIEITDKETNKNKNKNALYESIIMYF